MAEDIHSLRIPKVPPRSRLRNWLILLATVGGLVTIGAVTAGGTLVATQVITGAVPFLPGGGGGEFDGNCTTQNYWDAEANDMAWHPDECNFGTTINVPVNTSFSCNQNVAAYGTPPIRIINTWNQFSGVNVNGVTFDGGCSGDGTPAIDFIVYVTPLDPLGAVSDPMKTRTQPGPQNVDITGVVNCAAPSVLIPGPMDHQDGMQFQGGQNISLVNMYIGGNFETGVSNCQGAGGTAFYSGGGGSGVHLTHILGGKYVACNHALGIDDLGDPQPGSTIEHARFRNAFTNGSDYCSNFNLTDTCNITPVDADVLLTDVICQRWNGSTWVPDTP